MTQREEDEAHDELRRLFADTAQEAAGPTLTKLAARALDIPQRALRTAWFLPRWAWGSAVAGAAVALGGLLALKAAAPRQAAEPVPVVALASGAPVASMTVATASAREVKARAARAGAGPGEESSDGPELLGEAEEGARFDVSGPQSDRDLDAWLAATKELSGGT